MRRESNGVLCCTYRSEVPNIRLKIVEIVLRPDWKKLPKDFTIWRKARTWKAHRPGADGHKIFSLRSGMVIWIVLQNIDRVSKYRSDIEISIGHRNIDRASKYQSGIEVSIEHWTDGNKIFYLRASIGRLWRFTYLCSETKVILSMFYFILSVYFCIFIVLWIQNYWMNKTKQNKTKIIFKLLQFNFTYLILN